MSARGTEGSGPAAALIASFGQENWGGLVKRDMTRRKGRRRGRRPEDPRRRKPRFPRQAREKGPAPPSQLHRAEATGNFAARFPRLAPLSGFVAETAGFNAQRKLNPCISGVGRQQGELQGYEAPQPLMATEGGRRACSLEKGARSVSGFPAGRSETLRRATAGTRVTRIRSPPPELRQTGQSRRLAWPERPDSGRAAAGQGRLRPLSA
ncbi:MAG: RRXRR domain-containing protein [Deltaproteobacteria bacterium]|nr:RRXRR domain-containing protein [Deltaproteobacteria bacterium]